MFIHDCPLYNFYDVITSKACLRKIFYLNMSVSLTYYLIFIFNVNLAFEFKTNQDR